MEFSWDHNTLVSCILSGERRNVFLNKTNQNPQPRYHCMSSTSRSRVLGPGSSISGGELLDSYVRKTASSPTPPIWTWVEILIMCKLIAWTEGVDGSAIMGGDHLIWLTSSFVYKRSCQPLTQNSVRQVVVK